MSEIPCGKSKTDGHQQVRVLLGYPLRYYAPFVAGLVTLGSLVVGAFHSQGTAEFAGWLVASLGWTYFMALLHGVVWANGTPNDGGDGQ